MNVLVDTCVILDALQEREPFAQDAKEVCLAVARAEVKGFVAAKSVADIYYLMHRAYHDDKTTREELKKLFLSFGILDTTALDCRNAISSSVSDFEDAILAETAVRSGVDYIVTRKARDFVKAEAAIITPADFLKRLRG